MVHRRKTNSVVVACGDETQQELIPFKHMESWVVELVLSELTVTELEIVHCAMQCVEFKRDDLNALLVMQT